tara:strand:- start:3728 stop:4429 length:702 start_codon:yes stop_codon:yes gene_type:complete
VSDKWAWFKRNNVNLDISNACTLRCYKCSREKFHLRKEKVRGHVMTNKEWQKYLKHFHRFWFSGQLSDPLMHPRFPQILQDIWDSGKDANVHNAASHRPQHFYEKCFKAHPKANWIFGIDGLPKDSHKHRINQDGQKLFDMMLLSRKFLKVQPIWQYIIFSYNENDVDEAIDIAYKNGIQLQILSSGRFNEGDPLKPSMHFKIRNPVNHSHVEKLKVNQLGEEKYNEIVPGML